MKEDKVKKKEIKQLKSKLKEIEKDFGVMCHKVDTIDEEKTSLEKLVLEILSFGE